MQAEWVVALRMLQVSRYCVLKLEQIVAAMTASQKGPAMPRALESLSGLGNRQWS